MFRVNPFQGNNHVLAMSVLMIPPFNQFGG